MSTKLFTSDKVIKYAETRLFGRNVTPEMVAKIELHNGALPSELEQTLEQRYHSGLITTVQQSNNREPIYFVDGNGTVDGTGALGTKGTLFIPQFSGFGRAIRYERMIEAYKDAVLQRDGKDITFEVHDLEKDSRKTDQAYSNNAYDFVAGMFVPNGRYEDRRVFAGDDISDITTIIFGTPNALKKNPEKVSVLSYGNSEYLEAQILEINKQRILNIGYVFADQAGIIIEKMLREYNSLACKARPQNKALQQKSEQSLLTINMYMFGKVGGLLGDMQRHQLVYPVGIVDWTDLNEGRVLEYPMHNVLANNSNGDNSRTLNNSRTINDINGLSGLNLNVVSVVDETIEQLKLAKQKGCICIEMETRESVEAINQARRRYPQLKINFGFVGYVSDIPLKGDTLEKELDSDKGEQDAVKVILDRIYSK